MEKPAVLAIILLVVLALALGAVSGISAGAAKAWQSPAVVAQIAEQERAKAKKLQAEAETEYAKADKERAAALAAGAWSKSSAALAAEWAGRWPLVVALVLAAAAVSSMGGAVAWSRWAWQRAAVVALPGGLIALRQGKAVIVLDPARMIGGVLQLDAGGVLPVLQTSEELAADVARAALVARAVEKVGGSESRAEIAARVTESLSSAFSNMAGAANVPAAMVAGSPALRLVKVRSESEKKKAALIDDNSELREFVEVGAVRGFQRRAWAGYKFQCNGKACSQTRWAVLAQWLKDAELLDGATLVCSSSEALQRLGYEIGDAEESESEQ